MGCSGCAWWNGFVTAAWDVGGVRVVRCGCLLVGWLCYVSEGCRGFADRWLLGCKVGGGLFGSR